MKKYKKLAVVITELLIYLFYSITAFAAGTGDIAGLLKEHGRRNQRV